MEYNPQAKAFQVSLTLFADDTENALTRFSKKKYLLGGLGKDRKPDEVLTSYLEQNFQLINKKKQILPIRYIGKEISLEVVKVYFEIPFKDNLKSYTLKNTIMFELFEDQSNIVNLQKDGKNKSFAFQPKKPIFALNEF
ncbi:MAG: hypothetical protein OHK0045_03470 [Raineya sp.]